MPSSLRGHLVAHSTRIYIPLSFVLGLLALTMSTPFAALVLLLSVMRLFVLTIGSRPHALFKLSTSTVVLAAAATLSNARTSLSANPDGRAGILTTLFFLSALQVVIIVATLWVDWRLSRTTGDLGIKFFIFPVIWTFTLFIASSMSPLGYLATWTPTTGTAAYDYLRPMAGPSVIDFIAGAWAVVISQIIGAWVMGSDENLESETTTFVNVADENEVQEREVVRPHKLSSPFVIGFILFILTVPSFFQNTLPRHVVGDDVVPLQVACALPTLNTSEPHLTFKQMLMETQTLVSRAKIVLWPEGAVRFESQQDKENAIEKIAFHSGRSLVGVSFIEAFGPKDRNGIMFVDRNRVRYEYFKRNLVPFTESYSMSAGTSAPEIINFQLPISYNSRHKPLETFNVSITTSICLDFAHPRIFNELSERPTLILGPAHTWEQGIAVSMWEQALARASEAGSTLLWCDGGDYGLSGIGGDAVPAGDIVQVGSGSWVRTIGLKSEPNNSRTLYARFGFWFWVVLVCGVMGSEVSVNALFFELLRKNSPTRTFTFGGKTIQIAREGWRKKIKSLLQWQRGRNVDEASRPLLM